MPHRSEVLHNPIGGDVHYFMSFCVTNLHKKDQIHTHAHLDPSYVGFIKCPKGFHVSCLFSHNVCV